MKTIYKLTSPSGKVYIGQTKNLIRRLNAYRNKHCKRQPKLHNAIVKYGFENFTVEILIQAEMSQTELDQHEQSYIRLYDSLQTGYNSDIGGLNPQHRTSSATKGIRETVAQRKGKSLSKEWKQKLSEAKMGPKNHNYGKSMSYEQKLKISQAKKGVLKTAEHKQKLRLASEKIAWWRHHEMPQDMLDKKSKSAAVYRYTIVDPTGKQYVTESMTRFCKEHKLNTYHMCLVARKEKASYKNWTATQQCINSP